MIKKVVTVTWVCQSCHYVHNHQVQCCHICGASDPDCEGEQFIWSSKRKFPPMNETSDTQHGDNVDFSRPPKRTVVITKADIMSEMQKMGWEFPTDDPNDGIPPMRDYD